jgi:hypothetical protein
VQSQSIDDVLYQRSLAAVFGFRDVNDDWSIYRHTTDSGILTEIFQLRLNRGPGPEELRSFRAHFVAAVEDEPRRQPFVAVPGARRMLEEVVNQPGLQVAIATGGFADSALCKLRSAARRKAAFKDSLHRRRRLGRSRLPKTRHSVHRHCERDTRQAAAGRGRTVCDGRFRPGLAASRDTRNAVQRVASCARTVEVSGVLTDHKLFR